MKRAKTPIKVSRSRCPPSSSTPLIPSPAPLPQSNLAVGCSSLPSSAVRESALDQLISESTLIQEGDPSVYQLKGKKEKSSTMTRVTVGQRDSHKKNKTILLVGETGAGKSTFINALVNFTIGVKFQDKVCFQIAEEAGQETSEVTVYEVLGFEGRVIPFSLTIIDTPGFGGIRGIEYDDSISRSLLYLFRSGGIEELDGVGLVMKASDNRLSDRLMYILNSVMSLFGKNIEDNIITLITHSKGRTPKNVLQTLEVSTIKCAKDENQKPVYFLFNNCQSEDRTEEEEYLEAAYKVMEKGLKEFTAFLEKSQPQKLKTTVDVINERIKLTACIQNLQQRFIEAEEKQNQIRQIQHNLMKHKEEMEKNENFSFEVEESYKVKEPIKTNASFGKPLCCKRCEENCHYPGCTMAPALCEVIKGGHCTVCTGKCPTSDHSKENWRYVTKTIKVQTTLNEMKQNDEKNKMEKEKNSSYLESLDTEMKNLTAEKSQLLEESYKHITRLEKIALKVDSSATLVHLDFLIEKMREIGMKDKAEKLETLKTNVDEGSQAAVKYQHNSLDRRKIQQQQHHYFDPSAETWV
ncbi:PREDICTED: uncharacterized protein LOC107093942 isoform X1 [Cyprinodon variegatus]|uniref:Uncharacterized LOC107093942 n=1 Tax=Cyprinodon variegatus TaxID=28743 RepID=A0A3Q2FMW6_CYPVA|nr:PREDICTED: uncharacterized protein LOC107093942 isoform X1 [Cyprinodon variegatus]